MTSPQLRATLGTLLRRAHPLRAGPRKPRSNHVRGLRAWWHSPTRECVTLHCGLAAVGRLTRLLCVPVTLPLGGPSDPPHSRSTPSDSAADDARGMHEPVWPPMPRAALTTAGCVKKAGCGRRARLHAAGERGRQELLVLTGAVSSRLAASLVPSVPQPRYTAADDRSEVLGTLNVCAEPCTPRAWATLVAGPQEPHATSRAAAAQVRNHCPPRAYPPA